MSMEVERPLEPTEVISEGVQLARGSFLELLKINAVCLAPAMVIGIVITVVFVSNADDFGTIDQTTGEVSVDGGGILAGVGALLLVGLVFALASLVASIASFTTVSAAYLGHHVGWKDSLQRTLQRGGSLLLMMLVFFGVMAAPYILGVVVGFVVPALGVLLFFLGFLWSLAATFLLCLALPVWVVERCAPIDALKRSVTLVRGAASHVFVTGLLWFIVSIGVMIVVAIVGTIVGFVVAVILGGVAQVVMQFFISVGMTAWASSVLAVLYVDVRRRVEGLGKAQVALDMGFAGQTLGGGGAYAQVGDAPFVPAGGASAPPPGYGAPPPPPQPGYAAAPPPPPPGGYAAPPPGGSPAPPPQPSYTTPPEAPPMPQPPPAMQPPPAPPPPPGPPPAPQPPPGPSPAPQQERPEWRPPRV